MRHAQEIGDTFRVDHVGTLEEMLSSDGGGVFVNATDVGSPWNKGEKFVFAPDFLRRFGVVADCTFVPLVPQLIAAAQEAGVVPVAGWKMFVHQGAASFGMILGTDIDVDLLGQLCRRDFEANWS
jgi:shikimate 5-dehydrogenase